MSLQRSSPLRSRRGSVLLVALLLAAIIGISLVSYINLANNSLKQASRSFYANSAMNVAEIGLERAIACFNELDSNPSIAWNGWTTNNATYNATSSPTTPWAKGTFTPPTLGPDATGAVKVYVHHHQGSTIYNPKIVAKAIVSQTGAPAIEKYIEVTLRKRSLFANGLVAKDDVTWSGTPKAASWNSDPDNNSATAAIPYSSTVMTANITVGSLRGDIGLAGGTVWGYAKTGPTGTISGGSVHGLGTTTDDATRRTNDFNATFPDVKLPTPNPSTAINTIASNITASKALPGGTDVSCTATINNVTGTYYFYTFAAGTGVKLAGGDTLTINGNVVLLLNSHTGTECISTTGTASLSVTSGATLNVYTNGNVAIGGNGLINTSDQPKNCFFWGTRTTDGQTFDISGNGQLKAVIYAPHAEVSLNGGGTSGLMLGSVIAKEISMNGGTEFYYDESLANITTGNPWGIAKWKELQTESERNVYTSQLNF